MGFHFPALLWLGALAIPLLLLYVLKVRRQPQAVSSILLWRATMREVEAQVPLRRLRRDWLLLLQLLVLGLLVLAAAGPFRRALLPVGGRAAIVVDASAGMLAGGRMEQARRRVAALLDGRGSRDEVLLVRAGVRPQVLVPLTADARALRDGVDRLQASPAGADLPAALGLARSILGGGGRLLLVTDGTTTVPPFDDLEVLRVGRALSNVGIVALGVRAADPSGSAHEVFVRLRNASDGAADGALQLVVEEDVRDVSAVRLDPEGEARRTMRLIGVDRGVVEVRWQGEGPDALPADDRAQWVLRPPRRRGYRIVGEADPYLRHALASVDGWTEARAGRAADLEIVVGGAAATEGPPMVWIDPPELRRELVRGGSVLSWERAHPVLRFVNLNPVRLGGVPHIDRPPGFRVLAESTAGPLILAGTRSGRRTVLWAFDPVETSLPLSVSFPLLVHNTLEFLAPREGALPGGVPSGTVPPIPWSETAPARLVSPNGEVAELAPTGGTLRLPPLDALGVWRLEGDGEELRFAVSLLDPTEADLRPRAPAAAGPAPPSRSAADGYGTAAAWVDLWRPLTLAVLALLVLEGLAFHRRWST